MCAGVLAPAHLPPQRHLPRNDDNNETKASETKANTDDQDHVDDSEYRLKCSLKFCTWQPARHTHTHTMHQVVVQEAHKSFDKNMLRFVRFSIECHCRRLAVLVDTNGIGGHAPQID